VTEDDPVSRCGLPAQLEVCSTPAIHPDLASVETPGLALDAWRPATLVHHSDAAAGISAAVVSLAIVGGAGDLPAAVRVATTTAAVIPIAAAAITTAKPKVGAAAPVDPDAASVVSPRLPLDAWRSAALVNQAHAILGRYLANMTLAVIRGAGNLASVLRSDTALRAEADTTECHPG
jgi:hypothetical protein